MTDYLRYGYYLHPSQLNPPLGHAALDVYLADSDPTRYFDAQAAIFSVTDGDKTKPLLVVHPPLHARQTYQVVFGRYYLLAYDGDMVEGVSMGGRLEVEAHDTYTQCHLTSPAPLLDIEESGGLVTALEPEIEAELARLRAQWTGGDAAFDRQLARLDPLTLFAASLALLDDYLHNHPQAIAPDDLPGERTAIRRAIRSLQEAGQWPKPLPSLRALILQGQPGGQNADDAGPSEGSAVGLRPAHTE